MCVEGHVCEANRPLPMSPNGRVTRSGLASHSPCLRVAPETLPAPLSSDKGRKTTLKTAINQGLSVAAVGCPRDMDSQPAAEAVAHDGSLASPFFQLLTFDLRYHIYSLAFGNRILHLYLLYRRAL